MPRRRSGSNVIARIPGQKGTIKIEPSKYRIKRGRDRIFVDGRRARGRNVSVKGNVTHVHTRAGAARASGAASATLDIAGRRRHIDSLIAKQTKYVTGLVDMPSREKIDEKVREYAKTVHPIKDAFSPWKPWSVDKRSGRLIAWYLHPLRTIGRLLPIEIGMGIGRKTRRGQIREYRANLEGRAKAFEDAKVQERATAALDAYKQQLETAFAGLQENKNMADFERLLGDANTEFKRQLWGREGALVEYTAKTGREKMKYVGAARPQAAEPAAGQEPQTIKFPAAARAGNQNRRRRKAA